MKQPNKKSGFTLVELAIVLVIIGLIVGGVLAGADLIKAATIRNSQNQLAAINTNATAFQAKYSALPGDMRADVAAAAFPTAPNTAVATFNGNGAGSRDGNGLIEPSAAGLFPVESIAFWTDLTAAGLLAQGSTATTTALTGPSAAISAANQGTFTHTLKLRGTAGAIVAAGSPGNAIYAGQNHFVIGEWIGTTTAGVVTLNPAMTPLEARAFDEKFDDAAPLTGVVTALAANGARAGNTAYTAAGFGPVRSPAGVAATTACLTAAASPGAYAVANTAVNCVIAMRTSF